MSQSEWNNNPIEDPAAGGLGEGTGEERVGRFKPNINASTLTLVACFIAAIAVLYLLGLQNKPRAASASELAHNADVEKQITEALHFSDDPKVAGALKDAHKWAELLTRLDNGEYQESDLPRNPFERDVPPPVIHVDTGSHGGEPPPPLPPAVDPNVRLAEQEFLGLRLQIVMMGVSNSALINNMVVQKGTHFKYLVVDEIKPGEVILKYTDKDNKEWPFDLKSEPPQPGKN